MGLEPHVVPVLHGALSSCATAARHLHIRQRASCKAREPSEWAAPSLTSGVVVRHPNRQDWQGGDAMKLLLTLWAAGLLVAPAAADARHSHPYTVVDTGSPSEYYTNSIGQRVHRPVRASQAPSGASAQCRDGSWSFSQHRQGTCSHHGGVGTWR